MRLDLSDVSCDLLACDVALAQADAPLLPRSRCKRQFRSAAVRSFPNIDCVTFARAASSPRSTSSRSAPFRGWSAPPPDGG